MEFNDRALPLTGGQLGMWLLGKRVVLPQGWQMGLS